MHNAEIMVLRELARRYVEVCAHPRQNLLRQLWKEHNSLRKTRPLVIFKIFGDGFWRELPELEPQARDPLFRTQEMILRRSLFQASLGDDTVYEPWLEEWATYVFPSKGLWGFPLSIETSDLVGGAYKGKPALDEWSRLGQLANPVHAIDEAATDAKLVRLRDAVGDILPARCIRAPYYRGFRGDLSSHLGQLRGIENVMLDMYDNPRELHELLGRMSRSILAMHEAGQAAGDWRLTDHNNQAIAYCQELPDLGEHQRPVSQKELWCHMAAQELTLVSPAMHEEFMLRYQMPIMARFGLVAYGCCEDLTHKIDMLRQVKNLRRIAVTPSANLESCARQIGMDYVISWRPNPARMVCCDWQPRQVRQILSQGLRICQGQHVDITLKDVETIGGETRRLREWVQIAQDCAAAA